MTLREELDFLRNYASIEKTRFGDRLTMKMDIPPDTRERWCRISCCNRCWKMRSATASSRTPGPGSISISARRDRESLRLSKCADNGGGLGNGSIVEGIGLSNTRARLKQLYGGRQTFALATRRVGE